MSANAPAERPIMSCFAEVIERAHFLSVDEVLHQDVVVDAAVACDPEVMRRSNGERNWEGVVDHLRRGGRRTMRFAKTRRSIRG